MLTDVTVNCCPTSQARHFDAHLSRYSNAAQSADKFPAQDENHTDNWNSKVLYDYSIKYSAGGVYSSDVQKKGR